MKQTVTFRISGIKCDNCYWEDPKVKFEEYPKYLNKPCPVCGCNLLTKRDYKKILRMMKVIKVLGLNKSVNENLPNIKIKIPFRHKN